MDFVTELGKVDELFRLILLFLDCQLLPLPGLHGVFRVDGRVIVANGIFVIFCLVHII